jgi:hypothetical protein
MSSRDPRSEPIRLRSLGLKGTPVAIAAFRHIRKFTNRPFLLAVVVVCTLAVIFEYRVSISFFGGLQFEPAPQVGLANSDMLGAQPRAAATVVD